MTGRVSLGPVPSPQSALEAPAAWGSLERAGFWPSQGPSLSVVKDPKARVQLCRLVPAIWGPAPRPP